MTDMTIKQYISVRIKITEHSGSIRADADLYDNTIYAYAETRLLAIQLIREAIAEHLCMHWRDVRIDVIR